MDALRIGAMSVREIELIVEMLVAWAARSVSYVLLAGFTRRAWVIVLFVAFTLLGAIR